MSPRRLQQFFEASADRTPEAVAVDDGDREVTYGALEWAANRLAHLLRSRGIGSGDRVGILLHRSPLTYTALLGVLKAGAAFVPIDPASPPDRVRYIADDSALDLLLSTSELRPATEGLHQPVLVLDEDADLREEGPYPRLCVDPDGDAPCYVIYTSGSSGRPKGVEVAQSSICNFIEIATQVYDVQSTDRVYQGMTVSFDFSIEEIWPTFAAGATLVVGPNDSRRLGAELADFLELTGVTLFYCVPTLLATIPRDLPAVRGLMVGGEACPGGLVERWARPGRRMLNTYGPTEATVTATWGELLPGRPVTIGRPMPTYSIVILDENRRVVPSGTAGEICIGGPGVANGYVGMPEKTADKFVRYGPAGERIYRTGDLGRVDENGEIVYLGRADDEVKIRGHRVDLGEIESVLLDDPAVESAVAALLPVGGAEELVAYVTTRSGSADAEPIGRLHELLRERVPDYMVPGYLEVLPALPTMPSGKVDRRRLPAPSGRRLIVRSGDVVTADGPMEVAVRDAWATAFRLDPGDLSVTADFFADLGGHSLLAATAVSLLRERGVGVTPAVRDLYQNSTVRTMAAHLQARTDAASVAGATSRVPAEHAVVSSGRYGVAGALQGAYLYALMLLLTLPVVAIYIANSGQVSLRVLSLIALMATAVYLGLRWLLAPVMVRVLSHGVAPGRHRLWSGTYLQLWALDVMLSLAPLQVLSGSPLITPYLRLLGARVGDDVHMGTAIVSLPSLLRIGSGASVGYGVAMRPWVVENGWVVVEPITIGEGAFVGSGAVLEPGTTIGDWAVLAEQSTAARGQHIPAGERWVGSPSTRTDQVDETLAELDRDAPAAGWTRVQHLAVAAGLVLLELLPLLMLIPTVLLVWSALLVYGETVGLVSALLVGPVFVLTVCVTVLSVHSLVQPDTPVGVYPARSALGVRKWLADKVLEMSLEFTNSLYATLYTVPWLRALGAKVGRGAEVSTVAHLDPDLLVLGNESFIADMASMGGATFHHGRVSFRRSEVGARAFVGNAALIPPGTRLGDDSLVGVQTVPPAAGVPAGSAWLGSPAMHLPARQDSGDFAESLTFLPSRRRVAGRLAVEFLRITLPASLVAAAVYLYLLSLSMLAVAGTGVGAVALLAPLLAVLSGLAVSGVVAMVKWLVVGTYRPRVEPLWSGFVRRAEFVTGLYEAAAVPALLYLLVGTPFLPPVLRLFGARIGRRTFIASTYLTEFDLVEIDDDAAVGRDVSLQTHLFEDRVMKMSTVRVGPRASVGDRAVVLYDATVGADTTLEPLSLVMKGEQLPAGTHWRGIPAEGVA
ncbi:Pls/PosA family non-ribosomal peptide synthetase [Pseudonocardia charpentierae]|uniref:Amino acid adenylation domain-containing protein n=1 Tax=Pseudonocardia charpentierae TaxID=3075545 RepID=A0ABU2NBW9_9PSEU|nr:Pls/PosA family non-ribosomal peptide synthetase [Pseudonocardia sp. DSM 45834]MDT0351241.1 amino acid adenylation domain-containing protein [Pseudonocardia sp. DSM 45834]